VRMVSDHARTAGQSWGWADTALWCFCNIRCARCLLAQHTSEARARQNHSPHCVAWFASADVVPSGTFRTRDGKYAVIGGNGDSVRAVCFCCS
jgi:hypothetical protein